MPCMNTLAIPFGRCFFRHLVHERCIYSIGYLARSLVQASRCHLHMPIALHAAILVMLSLCDEMAADRESASVEGK